MELVSSIKLYEFSSLLSYAFPHPQLWLWLIVVSDASKYAMVKRDLHQRVKNSVRHVMSIIFLPNDKLNHRSSSGGVVGADEPLQWGRAQQSIALAQFSTILVHNCRIGLQLKTNRWRSKRNQQAAFWRFERFDSSDDGTRPQTHKDMTINLCWEGNQRF